MSDQAAADAGEDVDAPQAHPDTVLPPPATGEDFFGPGL